VNLDDLIYRYAKEGSMTTRKKDKEILNLQEQLFVELRRCENISLAVKYTLFNAIRSKDLIIISAWLKSELTPMMYYKNMVEICEDDNPHLDLLLHHLQRTL